MQALQTFHVSRNQAQRLNQQYPTNETQIHQLSLHQPMYSITSDPNKTSHQYTITKTPQYSSTTTTINTNSNELKPSRCFCSKAKFPTPPPPISKNPRRTLNPNFALSLLLQPFHFQFYYTA